MGITAFELESSALAASSNNCCLCVSCCLGLRRESIVMADADMVDITSSLFSSIGSDGGG